MPRFSGKHAIYLPLMGALVGIIGGVVGIIGGVVGTIATAAVWTMFALAPRERGRPMLALLTALAGFALRYIAIAHVAEGRTFMIFVAAQIIPRAAWIALALVSRPAPRGLGYKFSSTLVSWEAVIAILEGVAAAMWLGLRPGVMILAGTYLIFRAVQWISYRYAGGVSANSFGAMQVLTELYVLFLFDCAACRW